MAKSVSAQVLAPVPPRYYDDMIDQDFPLQHTQDHHTCTGFAIISLYRDPVRKLNAPSIVSGLGIGLVASKLF
mgnify:CR=1 FL=1